MESIEIDSIDLRGAKTPHINYVANRHFVAVKHLSPHPIYYKLKQVLNKRGLAPNSPMFWLRLDENFFIFKDSRGVCRIINLDTLYKTKLGRSLESLTALLREKASPTEATLVVSATYAIQYALQRKQFCKFKSIGAFLEVANSKVCLCAEQIGNNETTDGRILQRLSMSLSFKIEDNTYIQPEELYYLLHNLSSFQRSFK